MYEMHARREFANREKDAAQEAAYLARFDARNPQPVEEHSAA